MKRILSSKAIYFCSASLPVAALAIFFLFGPTKSVLADGCYYGGQLYSVGAQIADNCSSGNGQQCQNGGTWSKCIPME